MTFRLDLTVARGDCDQMGIVFYPNYCCWFDSAFPAFTGARAALA